MELPVPTTQLSRRDVLAAGLALTTLTAGTGMTVGTAKATPAEAKDVLNRLTGGAEPKTGRVKLTVAEFVENGATVPVAVTVESPMTQQDYVKAIHIVAENNPAPEALVFHLTPDCGSAEVSARIRLARSQTLTAAALMSDGSCYVAKADVKVTIGGCGN